MNIYLTLDYELFFGHTSGSTEKCMLEPTDRLLAITERTGARMTYFIDAGYLYTLKKLSAKFPDLKKEYERVFDQIQRLVNTGNDCQLHIHPHWEDAAYIDGKWQFNVNRYKLSDFSQLEVLDIFDRYAKALREVSNQKIHSYRAGGWCLQPFSHVKDAFDEQNIQIDSTVFPGGHSDTDIYYYDFKSIKTSKPYRFEDELCTKKENGKYLELPIAGYTYSPLFFWQLYGWGRIIPSRHKPLGNGYPISHKGERTNRLTNSSRLSVSLDGYFAKKLTSALQTQIKQGDTNDFVVIGHPKACTLYSLEQLEKFIMKHKEKHNFCTFSDALINHQ